MRSIRGPAHIHIGAIKTVWGNFTPPLDASIEAGGWLFFGHEQSINAATLPLDPNGLGLDQPPPAPTPPATVEP